MNEKTRKLIVFLSLPIAIAWGAWNFIGKPGQESPVTDQSTIQPLTGSAVVPSDTMQAELTAESPWGKDPFSKNEKRVDGISTAAPVYWSLSGVVYSKTDPLAIINNKFVRVGDQIDGATVTTINKSDVIIDYKGKAMTLYISNG